MTIFFLKGFEQGFKDFSQIIVNIVNLILLFPVYFIGIGITSIIAKILGKHFLDLKIRDRTSYWIDRKITKEPMESYYMEF
jgi:hypothetical protein